MLWSLWLCFGLALAVFFAGETTASAGLRVGTPPAAVGSIALQPACAALDLDRALPRCPAEPRDLRSDRDPSSAVEAATEPESQKENEDEDASETPPAASSSTSFPADVLECPRRPDIDTRRRTMSIGLGRGPPVHLR